MAYWDPPSVALKGLLTASSGHYRLFFNVGIDTRVIGIGAAKTPGGNWYYCVLGGDVNPTPSGTVDGSPNDGFAPSLSPQSLVGTYTRAPVENGWHTGTLAVVSGNSMRWTNQAGVSWTLTLRQEDKTLVAGADSPYSGKNMIVKTNARGQVTAIEYQDEIYSRR